MIEERVKVTLPDDVAYSLSDGVVLCHFINQIRGRAVQSIHVPSQAVVRLLKIRFFRDSSFEYLLAEIILGEMSKKCGEFRRSQSSSRCTRGNHLLPSSSPSIFLLD